MRTCKQCQNDFQPSKDRKHFCSSTCYTTYRRENTRERKRTAPPPNVACEWCGKMVYRQPSHRRNHVYCSRTCSNQAQSKVLQEHTELRSTQGVPVTCHLCGKVVYVKAYRAHTQKFCSKACAATSRFGKPFPMTRPDHRGDKNPNYQGKVTSTTARQVAMRYHAPVCMICAWDVSVDIHHIIPRRHGGTNDPANLAVLCPNHHRMAELRLISQDELKALVHDRLTAAIPMLMQLAGQSHG